MIKFELICDSFVSLPMKDWTENYTFDDTINNEHLYKQN